MALYHRRQYSSENMELSRVLEKGRPQTNMWKDGGGGGSISKDNDNSSNKIFMKNFSKTKINKIYLMSLQLETIFPQRFIILAYLIANSMVQSIPWETKSSTTSKNSHSCNLGVYEPFPEPDEGSSKLHNQFL
jgi:hypothetical protein